MGYKVDLDAFSGPMDLLLYLVRRSEVDIYDIPIAEITEQFVGYIELMDALDIEYAAAFLVMAATLMDIKARTLLPSEAIDDDAEQDDWLDPREELIRELLEYKKVRDTAIYLDERFEDRSRRFESGGETPQVGERPLEEVQVWDLMSAFADLLKETGQAVSEIVSSELPVKSFMSQILARLESFGRVEFTLLFEDRSDRAALIGVFLALLELMRMRKVRAFQDGDFARITIELCAPEQPPENSGTTGD